MSTDEIKKLDDTTLDEVAGGKTNYEVARDVIDGKYGNGDERIRRLRAAGYDPYAVQQIVNQMVRNGYLDPYRNPFRNPDDRFPPNYVDPYK